MQVKRITTLDTFPIRNAMLRPGRPVETCQFKGDDDEATFHLGAFVDQQLVSVASFYLEKHPEIEGEFHFRLRGMATLEDYQKQGFSSALLKTAIPLIKQNSVPLLWCNARTSAQGFYEKIGFKAINEVFEIPEVGAHKLMLYNI